MPQSPLNEILSAGGLSAASSQVLQWSGLFARAFGARVEILHANWFEMPRYFTPSQIERSGDDAREEGEAETRAEPRPRLSPRYWENRIDWQ